jgi:hypothetical protein
VDGNLKINDIYEQRKPWSGRLRIARLGKKEPAFWGRAVCIETGLGAERNERPFLWL